ncbi:MAG TPA: HAD-IIA family hydrolase [Anaerolineales bacterium]|jgi:4-nitrophenyl phosphatase|nr:HAD-IIA family hydrolase [Anaerolineales bacterium]
MLPSHIKSLIIDMDGVIWRADAPIGDLAVIFSRIEALGLKFVFATNNSTKTSEQYVAQLHKFGVDVEPWQVVTSSQAAAHAMAQTFPSGTKVFMIGEDGLRIPLEERGFEILSTEEAPQAEVVVMGLDRGITFQKAVEAALLVRSGVPFYATNPDRTFPTPRGLIPGAGAWYAIVTTATDVEPIVAGKPFPFLMDLSLEKLDTKIGEALVIGDRLDTDIAAGQAVGCPTALVLSGVATREQAERWTPKIDILAEDLTTLIGSL